MPTAKKWKVSRMHALRHPQRDLGARQLDPADVVERAAHPHRGRAGARRVAIALEPQQERVAAELEQAGAVLVGDLEDRREAAADRVGDLLRALAALARELLGQLREAGDVGEHRGAFRGPVRRVRIGEEVLLQDAREVGNRRVRRPRPAHGGAAGSVSSSRDSAALFGGHERCRLRSVTR